MKEREDDPVVRRVAAMATWQVLIGPIAAVAGILGFITQGNPLGLVLAALGVGAFLYWNPVRQRFKNQDGDGRDGN